MTRAQIAAMRDELYAILKVANVMPAPMSASQGMLANTPPPSATIAKAPSAPKAPKKPKIPGVPKLPGMPKLPGAMSKVAAGGAIKGVSPWRHGGTAVVIKGNPDSPVTRGKELSEGFYDRLKKVLESEGLKTSFDPGKSYTTPPPADIWLGHSRGADRLRFAPEGVSPIGIGSEFKGAINHPDDVAYMKSVRDTLLKGGKNWKDIPVGDRPPAPEGHVILTPKMENELRERIRSLRGAPQG